MNSINLKKEGIYRIRVNKNGDCIEIDTNDIGLPMKCYESISKIEELEEKAKKEMQDLMASNDKEKYKKITILENEMFRKMRGIIDNVLGKNACQKIFGDRNYYSMFNDLFEELSKKREKLGGKSHFDMMGLNAKSITDKLVQKYSKNRKDII